ncbi:MAG: hypothetical protein RBG13Loki_2433 [Promethearchaeota archaeon CR_4]|nr:MAG: hypothetical protein RBG13Loki_2433 [Candidatus Lokiarchaeota archaeon CR_4]
MVSLDRIMIRGFKSIHELDLELRSMNVLIGINGSGKSNFISIFSLLNQIVEKNLQNYVGISGGADSLLYFGRKTTEEIYVKLNFGKNAYEVTLNPTVKDTLIFKDETCYFKYDDHIKKNPYPVRLGSGHEETQLYEEARTHPGKIAQYVLNDLKSWKVFHFHDTSESAKIKQTGDIGDNERLRPDASNLAAFLYMLQQTHLDYYEKIVSTIRLAAPFFDDFFLRPSPLNKSKILLEWREKGSDKYFNANTLSDGTLRFMCLATLLLQPKPPSLIIIDEPELGLHPYAIRLLGELLHRCSTQSQLIIATQSVTIVDLFAADDLIVVERREKQSILRRVDARTIKEWLEDYSMGELWEKNVLNR